VLRADHSCRGALLCACVCFLETLFFSNVRWVFQTDTLFWGKDVVLKDGRLIFISWWYFQDDIRPVVSNNKSISE
jgi:hypothetical protein